MVGSFLLAAKSLWSAILSVILASGGMWTGASCGKGTGVDCGSLAPSVSVGCPSGGPDGTCVVGAASPSGGPGGTSSGKIAGSNVGV